MNSYGTMAVVEISSENKLEIEKTHEAEKGVQQSNRKERKI